MILFGCDKDEVRERDYPALRTQAVNNITTEGARFNATLVSGDLESISEYGFVWDNTNNLSLQYSEKIMVNGNPGQASFSCEVTFALEAMEEYYVRPYVKSGNYTVYGEVVKFMSLGSQAPEITDFEPKLAHWGDTITIYGRNFSNQAGTNRVLFGELEGRITNCTKDSLQVIIPGGLTQLSIYIAIEIFGNRSTALEAFNLIVPGKIITIDKTDITWGDTVELTGIFPFSTHAVGFKIENTNAVVLGNNESNIKIIVPNTIAYTDSVTVYLMIDGKKLAAPNRVHMVKPRINSISPAAMGWSDTIILGGIFHPVADNNRIFFSSFQATLLEVKSNSIKCIIPYTNSHLVSLTANIQSIDVNYPDDIQLSGPIINDIDPRETTSSHYVTIKGKYFKGGSTIVKVNSIESSVVEVTSDHIVVYISNVHPNGPASVEVSVYNKKVQLNGVLKIINPKINDFSPTSGTYRDLVTINGEGFDPENLEVRIGNSPAEIVEATESKVRIIVPDNLNYADNGLTLSTRGTTINGPTNFHLLPPEITSFAPASGKVDETITISGSYFNPVPQYNHVYLRSTTSGKAYYANIKSGSTNMIQIDVPSLTRDFYEIQLERSNQTCVATSNFFCQSPWKEIEIQLPEEQNYGASVGLQHPNSDYSEDINEVFIFGGFYNHYHWQSFNLTKNTINVNYDFPIATQEVGGFSFAFAGVAYYGVSNPLKDKLNSIFTYNPKEGTWNNLGIDFPGPGRIHALGFSISEIFGFVLGGENEDGLLNDFWLYTLETASWSRLSDYPGGPTSGATAVVIDDNAYVIDGNQLWVYNSTLNTWESKSTFPGPPRKLATGFSISGKVYYGTGSDRIDYHNNVTCYNDLWEYNPSTDTWKKLTSIPDGYRTNAFGYSYSFKGYIGGGCILNWLGFRNIFEYDPSYE
ncbi:MAG: IPT/TIG domain-containing protein [Bacteroidales bacterium]|nr:IPT/TIG domain-containing protein [Bacteroidales bacterium]